MEQRDAAALIAVARECLAGAPRAALGELVVPRRFAGLGRSPRIEPRGHAWHLGALLIGDDDVYATGTVIRAREEVRRGYTAESQHERAALAAAAWRGGFPEGAVVHIDWQPVDLAALAHGAASGPLAVRDGVPVIRWSASADPRSLDAYLAERVTLLLEPPTGST